MLVRIRKPAFVLLAAAAVLSGCASENKTVALVNDPDAKKESAIPWNKQEQWESAGPWANMTDKRN